VSIVKLHHDEVDINHAIVQKLIDSQFPQYSNLEIRLVEESGTDNVMFRLGNDMSIRLPRKADAEASILKECKWLPLLAPHLPLAIPELIQQGKVSNAYPFIWSICNWHDGEKVSLDKIDHPHQLVRELAEFINALQDIDTSNAPQADHPFHRGVSLIMRDEFTRSGIRKLEETIDSKAALSIWEDALKLDLGSSPVWIHGDLHKGNLLAHRGKLSAVIDFGAMRVGDLACDLMPAWNLFDKELRDTFREAINVDEHTWLRGRAWALSVSVTTLPYYMNTNPFLVNLSRYTIDEILNDYNA